MAVRRRAQQERKKIVIRYADGKLVKAYTNDSALEKTLFRFRPLDPAGSGIAVEVSLQELKAVFFVKDFCGNPTYREKKYFTERQQPAGRKVEVTFVDDDELLVGSTSGCDPGRAGFFITPADPNSNNEKIFVVSSAISKFRYL
jgi:hypothetical protein